MPELQSSSTSPCHICTLGGCPVLQWNRILVDYPESADMITLFCEVAAARSYRCRIGSEWFISGRHRCGRTEGSSSKTLAKVAEEAATAAKGRTAREELKLYMLNSMDVLEDRGGGAMTEDDVGVGNGLASEDMDNATHCSVVLHVDLDAFYAAVEQVRLGIPREKPLAVQQWRGLIAINYAARAAGITRHERADQALRKCPELILVHVETIGEEGGVIDAGKRGQTKVSLERYRQASASVFSIFRRYSDVYEKASIDEAYLDVTAKVEVMISQSRNWDHELQRLLANNDQGCPTMVVLDGPLVLFNSYDRRMLAGAIIADDIRTNVRNELGYTCSVGIATNKLLAKIGSAKNKPDRQTLVPPRAVPNLMQAMPLKKMRLLGGKLGEELTQKWGFSTAGEAQALSLATLVSSFGERQGKYVWNAVRGIQADKVEAKQVPKSMLAAKSFSPIKELLTIRRWLGILSEELAVRMLRDFQQNHRHPRLLQLYYRSGGFKHAKDHSKSWSMPHGALSLLSSSSLSSHQTSEAIGQFEEPSPEDEQHYKVDLAEDDRNTTGVEDQQQVMHSYNALTEDLSDDHTEGLGFVVTEKSKAVAKVLEDAAYNMFKRLDGTFPCTRLALAASSFQDLGAQGTKSIQDFFSNTGAVAAETTTSPKKLNANFRETNSEKSKGKQKGIMKYLHHVSSMQDIDGIPVPSKSLPDNHHNDRYEDDRDEPSREGHVKAEPSAATPEKALTSNKTSKYASSSSVAVVGSDCPINDSSDTSHPTSDERHLAVNHEIGGKPLTSTAPDSAGNVRRNETGNSEQFDNRKAPDLAKVDMKEQMRILAEIQRSTAHAPVSEKQVRKQSGQSATKRPRQSNAVAGQQSIGKFFRAQGKPA